MAQLVARRVRIETASEDENGILLFLDGKLIACLLCLSAAVHGDLRGHWCIELALGFDSRKLPDSFSELDDAIAAVTARLTGEPIGLSEPIKPLL